MKITDIKVHVVAPMGDVWLAEGTRLGYVLVEVVTDEGVSGVGECTNWPRKGNTIVARTIEEIKHNLIGRDPSHIDEIWHMLFRQYTYLGNRGLITAVMSGIDIALWDLRGKALGVPVYDLLGGPIRDSILLYTHPGGRTPEDAAANSKAMVEQGFTAFKFDPFFEVGPRHTNYIGGEISAGAIADAAEFIGAVRDAIGPRMEILIDAHGNFNPTTALRCIRALQPYNIGWFEEPVPPEGTDALRQVRRQTDQDLCVGERLFTRWDFMPILQEGLANYLMPDVCWTGGITELKKISVMAEPYFIPMSPHNGLGPIQVIAAAHTMLTVPNFYRQEISSIWAEQYFNKCIDPHMDIRDGSLYLSDRPGLGVELDMEYINAHPHPDWQ